jgi:putative oxidoreductase
MSRHLPTAARILLGLAFTVFGLNFFLHFLPQPAMDPAAGAFLGALVAGKYLTVVKVIEVAAGLALLANRFVPLSLALLAPPLIGIFVFHAIYEPSGLVVPIILIALEVYLAWAYRAAFAPMLQARTATA